MTDLLDHGLATGVSVYQTWRIEFNQVVVVAVAVAVAVAGFMRIQWLIRALPSMSGYRRWIRKKVMVMRRTGRRHVIGERRMMESSVESTEF
jgi:hypothetical protein